MRLLLDTHILLWALVDDGRLTADARAWLENPQVELVVSAASIWEISIKHSLGKAGMPISGEAALGYVHDAGYSLLPVLSEHAAAAESLPVLHQDPFDRILVAQALTEPLRLMTHDRLVAVYSESLVILV
jgi:PIN domain nuclease of toxin-antitoxin system